MSLDRTDQEIASNMTKENFGMNPLRYRLKALSFLAVAVGALLFAIPAGAAPLTVSMDNDANELQRVAVNAASGQFHLTFDGDTTADISVGASAGEVQTALNALPAINSDGGSVSVDVNPTEVGREEFWVAFDGGPLAHTDVPQMTAAAGVVPLTGLSSRVSTSTLADAGISRSDRRVGYRIELKDVNPGTPVLAGTALECFPGTWSGTGAPAFAYQWLRNGEKIAGATGSSYATISPGDEGAVIQCQVTATNTIADVSSPTDFVGSIRVSNGIVIEPTPATQPPTPPTFIAAPPQTGALNGTVDRELTCNAGAWTDATTFTYQWHRNGVAIGAPVGPTASTSTKLAVAAGEQSPPAAFQCTVTAMNTGGSVTLASGNRPTAGTMAPNFPPNPNAPNNLEAEKLFITTPLPVAQVELPGGDGTYVLEAVGSGWNCTSVPPTGGHPAEAICNRTAANPAGGVYPTLEVAAGLGADAPDHAVASVTVTGSGPPATDDDEFDFGPPREFEISKLDAALSDFTGADYTQAGGHPFTSSGGFEAPRFRNLFEGLNPNYAYNPIENIKNAILDLPRGFVGNALAVPVLCPGLTEVLTGTCPPQSAVGGITVDLKSFGTGLGPLAIYAIEPEFGKPAQFAFAEGNSGTTYSLSPRLRADDGYAISLDAAPIPLIPALYGVSNLTLCSFGAATRPQTPSGGVQLLNGCKKATDPTANPKPLITLPTRCTGQPPTVKLRVDSWEDPGDFKSKEAINPTPTGCEGIDFQPEISLKPTSHQADSPSGMDVEIRMPTEGLESRTGLSQANLDNATVTFPKGMSINPAASHGLDACSPAQVKLGSNADDECPLSSRIGTAEIDTPLIRETLTGNVFVASQRDNPFRSTIGLYMVLSSKKDGITIKVAGKLEPDPATGQLTSSFVENPEAPFSRLSLKFNSGPRAPLINPPKCGTFAIHSELSPWSAASPANPTAEEIVAADSTYQITSGPNGGPCPIGGLEPKLEAGLRNATAGSKAPFVLKLSREDGSQRFTSLDMSLPAGLTAYLKGVPYCPEHVLGGISGVELTGRAELASPACPIASQVGSVQAGAGAGPFPFYAPGRVFLAGPYKGAPLSLAIVAPAVAGPFDLGSVVVRNALYIDPVTAQVTAKSDPIPTILHGILLDVRDIRVNIDRPGFTAAPTNCGVKSIGVRVGGEGGASASLSNRFQVGDCAALGFKPNLSLRLFGGTKRGAHPRLRAIVRPRLGDANFASASVALPHSEFLDQSHIKTICTRVQFAAKACPAGSIYGRAEATTPLLDKPLTGPVYLRSSSNPLPDLVAALRGPDGQPIEVHLAGRIDSINGGIRTSFDFLPDQPVSSFTLNMQGGKKGLLVNSRNLCKSVSRATVRFGGQNGRAANLRPKLQTSCKKAKAVSKKQGRQSKSPSAP
jgi:hypothetical protein